MSEILKLYVRGGFEFVDGDTGFTTSDFGVSDNSLNERVTSRDAPAYEPEIEFVKECIEDGVYDVLPNLHTPSLKYRTLKRLTMLEI